ncbi:uncharacterized protein LOC118738381 [Rhagoletis pomonella]|uniref:uncharacterized protein LOC118738381 n=1 Tax=Rhagoletis pomonella TaxID=28610 RepID=UPI0017864AE8|nr:uncharacterized protein LOC118738381 [Rhagoletis pomonella]
MQYFRLLISILTILAVKSKANDTVQEPLFPTDDESAINSANGPVSTAMESLAYNTASIADEISFQVSTKLERTADILHGGIELLIANALEQLAQPIYQASRKLGNDSCNATFTAEDLRSTIDTRLSICTEELNGLMQTYKSEADNSVSAIDNFVITINRLPDDCQGESWPEQGLQSFATATRCFIEGITALNAQISQELNTVSLLLSRTRQLSQQSETQALVCIEKLVNEIVKLVDEKLKDC